MPTKYKKAFGILVIERIKMQQNVDDIEYLVFKHITNPDELIEKVNNARLILAHINEFAMLDIIEDGKCKKEKVLKGTIACLFYLWTGTKMSQSDFLENIILSNAKMRSCMLNRARLVQPFRILTHSLLFVMDSMQK